MARSHRVSKESLMSYEEYQTVGKSLGSRISVFKGSSEFLTSLEQSYKVFNKFSRILEES